MMPTFLLIGAAKSGTTAHWSFLRQHPQVFVPGIKEPNYFAFDEGVKPAFRGPGITINDAAITTRSAYEALFEAAGSARAVGEASNLYLYMPGAAERIARALPEVKLVAILRQPADRAFSSYLHLKRQGREPAATFEEALRLEEGRIADEWGFLCRYRDLGYYGRQLRAYLDRFPRERILVHLYEDFARDPGGTVRRTYEFLGVDPTFEPDLSARPNQGGVPRAGWRGALLSRRNPARRLFAPLMPAPLRNKARKAADSRALTREAMDAATRRSLTDGFRPDIKQLESLIGRDLGPWLAREG
jgi:hypothetical protein